MAYKTLQNHKIYNIYTKLEFKKNVFSWYPKRLYIKASSSNLSYSLNLAYIG